MIKIMYSCTPNGVTCGLDFQAISANMLLVLIAFLAISRSSYGWCKSTF